MEMLDHYRMLAERYRRLGDHPASPLVVEAYRKLAEGYTVLVQALESTTRIGLHRTLAGGVTSGAPRSSQDMSPDGMLGLQEPLGRGTTTAMRRPSPSGSGARSPHEARD